MLVPPTATKMRGCVFGGTSVGGAKKPGGLRVPLQRLVDEKSGAIHLLVEGDTIAGHTAVLPGRKWSSLRCSVGARHWDMTGIVITGYTAYRLDYIDWT